MIAEREQLQAQMSLLRVADEEPEAMGMPEVRRHRLSWRRAILGVHMFVGILRVSFSGTLIS